jgi:hypothetical protein
MTAHQKCKKSGLQSEYKVVYNQPIAVTPACLSTAGTPHHPDSHE